MHWSSDFLVDTAIAITLVEWMALALRCALQGQNWLWGAGCLAASGLAPLTYLRQRWQRQRETAQAFLA